MRVTRISGVYSSPLSRALETAEIVARDAGYPGEVVRMPDLMERHGGILEGHTWTEQEARNPALAKKFLSLPEEERWTLVGAETEEEIMIRFERALSEIRSRHRTADGPLVIVTHGGIMRTFLRNLFGPTVFPGAERAPNASITRLFYDPSEPDTSLELLELASMDHLLPKEVRQTQAE